MSGNEWFLILFTTNTIHFPNVTTVDFLLFIKSQLTTNAQTVLRLNQCTRVLVRLRVVRQASQLSW
jgi:hypothetical protein